MALRPSLSFLRIGSIASPHTLELYLDTNCPFSAKLVKSVDENLVPRTSLVQTRYLLHPEVLANLLCGARVRSCQWWGRGGSLLASSASSFDSSHSLGQSVEANPSSSSIVSLTIPRVYHCRHGTSTYLHEAALAFGLLSPESFWDYFKLLMVHQEVSRAFSPFPLERLADGIYYLILDPRSSSIDRPRICRPPRSDRSLQTVRPARLLESLVLDAYPEHCLLRTSSSRFALASEGNVHWGEQGRLPRQTDLQVFPERRSRRHRRSQVQ
jgi:hypothetical protein